MALDNNFIDEVFDEIQSQPPEPEPPPDWDLTTPMENLPADPNIPPARTSSQKRWTVAELLDAEFPEPKWAIPNLIPEGLSIIGGRPKVGKSWLLLQAAIAVGSGGMF